MSKRKMNNIRDAGKLANGGGKKLAVQISKREREVWGAVKRIGIRERWERKGVFGMDEGKAYRKTTAPFRGRGGFPISH